MTTTPENSGGNGDQIEDQDAEPSLNAPDAERPDGQDPAESGEDGGDTDDVI